MDQFDTLLASIAELNERVGAMHTEVSLVAQETKHNGQRLDKLNGAVARHEAALNERALEAKRLEGMEDERAKNAAKWETRLRPVVLVLLGVGAVLLLQQAPVLLRAVAAVK